MEIDQSSSTRLKRAFVFGRERGFFDNGSEHESERGPAWVAAWAAASVGVGPRQTQIDGCN